ncbi:DUF2163 domain-containing protein [Methylobacterium aquaticum]|uniref:DUF2163 domain-containing protein n=1 Tax=Methylobacterium aquaticum TaxID=270351 RepID=UPI003D1782C0
MKAASPALVAHLTALRAQRDVALLYADCFTITLRSGTAIAVTNADVAVPLNGFVYLANSLMVDGLRFRCSVGLEVDQQQVTLSARSTDLIGGVPALVAIRNGALDGARIRRERAFLTDWTVPPVGAVLLFQGRVSTVDAVGRTAARITVASDLVLLDVDMPRNVWQPTCNHVLFDSGCGLPKEAFGASGAAGAGATPTRIPWTGAAAAYAQGTVTMTGGANAGATATIKTADGTGLTLAYPLPAAPAAGDTFVAYQGCDHTLATCRAKFSNGDRFRGFPFVPTPETALG